MEKVHNIIQFGEEVEGYAIPVLNEREIRAAAGILFLTLFVAVMLILFKQDFLMVKYVIVIFLTDFSIRIFISPRFSPVLIIGRLIVSNQVPEYVGAPQKKFAWKIGLTLSLLMFILLDVLNYYSLFTGISCLACLIFLFFESAFGICIGCVFYNWLYKDKAIYCSGETCDVSLKHPIQKTSLLQLLIVAFLIVYVLLVFSVFNNHLQVAPGNMNEVINRL